MKNHELQEAESLNFEHMKSQLEDLLSLMDKENRTALVAERYRELFDERPTNPSVCRTLEKSVEIAQKPNLSIAEKVMLLLALYNSEIDSIYRGVMSNVDFSQSSAVPINPDFKET